MQNLNLSQITIQRILKIFTMRMQFKYFGPQIEIGTTLDKGEWKSFGHANINQNNKPICVAQCWWSRLRVGTHSSWNFSTLHLTQWGCGVTPTLAELEQLLII